MRCPIRSYMPDTGASGNEHFIETHFDGVEGLL